MKFQAFKDGKLLNDLDVRGAYLVGTDGIAIRKANIKFANECVECSSGKPDTASLVLFWPVEGYGRVLLPTTTLPERDRPYCLNIELARGKFMQILNKCEDWAFYEKNGMGQLYEEARSLFIKAIGDIGNVPQASVLADEALSKAMTFAEQLATQRAQQVVKMRVKNKGFSKNIFSVRAENSWVENEECLKKAMELATHVSIPISWAKIEKHKGKYDFSKVDQCVSTLARKRLILSGGPLLRFHQTDIPQWLIAGKANFETVRESAYRFITEIATRYANRIRTWTVISGLNNLNHFGFDFEQVLELTRAATMAVKNVDGRIKKVIEIENPWGEYYSQKEGTKPPLDYNDMIVQGGINFDAFGLRMDFASINGALARDMMQISALLDYIAPVAKPFWISDVAVPTIGTEGQEWTPAKQAIWLERFCVIALSKPHIESVIYSKMADKNEPGELKTGLLSNDLQPKESFARLTRIRKAILGT